MYTLHNVHTTSHAHLLTLHRLSCSYLAQVIASDIIRHHFFTSDLSQLHVLNTWLRGVVQSGHIHSSSSHAHSETAVQQLTNQLPRLPLVASLLGNQTPPLEPVPFLTGILGAMQAALHIEVRGQRRGQRLITYCTYHITYSTYHITYSTYHITYYTYHIKYCSLFPTLCSKACSKGLYVRSTFLVYIIYNILYICSTIFIYL